MANNEEPNEKRKIQLTINLSYPCPKGWSDEDIYFWLNEGSFCLTTLLDAIKRTQKKNGEGDCICYFSEARIIPKEKENEYKDITFKEVE